MVPYRGGGGQGRRDPLLRGGTPVPRTGRAAACGTEAYQAAVAALLSLPPQDPPLDEQREEAPMTHPATLTADTGPGRHPVTVPRPRREGETGRGPSVPTPRTPPVLTGLTDLGRRSLCLVERLAPAALRLSLAVLFVWFGALKLSGDSPVLALVSATVPWVAPHLLMTVLGAVEVLLGLGLAVGYGERVLLLVLAGHLAGTFLSFVMAPELVFQGGNPLLLTADGEFVLKNLVLVTGALLLAARGSRSR